jgi:hypothetical protein
MKAAQYEAPTLPFDGETYEPARDHVRLARQLAGVRALMADGRWRTLPEIARHVEGSEAALSARLRDLRKRKFGGRTVERRYLAGGLFEYRVVPIDA